MKLYDNWRQILRKSWTLRFIIIAGLLSGAEVALPLIGDQIQPGIFAGLSAACTALAFIARLVAQKDI